ncbi:hypothetical protein I3843_05G229200 [Carya illinoinensis]|nr:hypothetical protein I3843_05G229200 [Carya illinoinensis]
MSSSGQQQQNGVIGDPETAESERKEQTLPPKWIENILTEGLFLWCVLSVIVDPFFFYVPVINEERKCIALDRRLYISITCLRTVLDSILLLNIILQCLPHFANARPRGQDQSQPESGQTVSAPAEMTGTESGQNVSANPPKLLKLLLWLSRLLFWHRKAQPEFWSLAIDVLAILPIPQVLLPIIFSKPRGFESLNKIRKVLTAVVLVQYVPRVMLIRLLSLPWRKAFSKEGQDGGPFKRVIAVKAGLNLFMFIVASHILGGFWYFFSIERETACWHLACENHIECNRSSFDCKDRSVGNYTFLNDYCPIQTPNTTAFDFGIFQGALQSGTVASMDFPRKILYCFWWGLRNLSSFGSNLQTSPHFWENCFAVLTSISGLLLFMYFLGRLQMYMQWEGQRQLQEAQQRQLEEAQREQRNLEEAQQRLKKTKQLEEVMKIWNSDKKARKEKVLEWIDRQPRLEEIRETIIDQVDIMFTEEENRIKSAAEESIFAAKSIISRSEYKAIVDAENPFPHFPLFTRRKIQRLLCLPLLQKVPLLKSQDKYKLKLISRDYLKQVYYNENSYIVREGEPLDALLFITRGIVWTYTTSPDHRQTGCLETDDFYGVELLEWVFKSPSLSDPSNLPFSTRTLRCQTKVEAFALTAGNISKFKETSYSNLDLQEWLKHLLFARRRNARQMTQDESG